jgi:hypothetical protein
VRSGQPRSASPCPAGAMLASTPLLANGSDWSGLCLPAWQQIRPEAGARPGLATNGLDAEADTLHSTIRAATNKSESFNDFVKWLAFGGGGVIAENARGEQRKIIKYDQPLVRELLDLSPRVPDHSRAA